jgi:sugar lactone lactonase YvrE
MQEPAPHGLGAPIARFDGDLSSISGVRELPDGRLLLSDFREPALHLVDLRTGASTRIGREGTGPNEYQQPGGIYPGRGDTSLVLDRSQWRVLLVTGVGRIAGMRSVALQGTTGSSSADVDRQRLDASGSAYFVDPGSMFARLRGAGSSDSAALWRFDAERQRADTLVMLRQQESRVLSAVGNVVRSQGVLFSPADGWGVSPAGRVAVVRAVPYRVDWIERNGRITMGPVTPFTVLKVTDEDRQAVANRNRQGVGIGTSGGGRVSSPSGTALFADTKPPFSPDDIIVSPDGNVWVGRLLPANAPRVVYDVFDGSGVRIDRVELPARSRVVGFGTRAVYVNERDADDLPHLRKYALSR